MTVANTVPSNNSFCYLIEVLTIVLKALIKKKSKSSGLKYHIQLVYCFVFSSLPVAKTV